MKKKDYFNKQNVIEMIEVWKTNYEKDNKTHSNWFDDCKKLIEENIFPNQPDDYFLNRTNITKQIKLEGGHYAFNGRYALLLRCICETYHTTFITHLRKGKLITAHELSDWINCINKNKYIYTWRNDINEAMSKNVIDKITEDDVKALLNVLEKFGNNIVKENFSIEEELVKILIEIVDKFQTLFTDIKLELNNKYVAQRGLWRLEERMM